MKGKNLREIRRALDITQGEIARAIDADVSLVSRIERGRCRETPRVVQMRARIASFLGVGPEQREE